MIDDETHPEWQAIQKALAMQISQIAALGDFSRGTLADLQTLCDSATSKARAHGFDFPAMVVAYFVQHRIVRIYNRDADHAKRQQYIVQLHRDLPSMSAQEIADGFRRAWPNYDPAADEKLASLKGPLSFPEEPERS